MAYLFLSILFPGAVAIIIQFIKIKRTRFDNKAMPDVDTFLFISEQKRDLAAKNRTTTVRYISPKLKDIEADTFTCMN